LDISNHNNNNNKDTHSNHFVWDDIYYRVDDESRTLLSGQVVLRGLFGNELDAFFDTHQQYPVVPLHTADYDQDILSPNHQICPRLTEIWETNMASPGYQAFNQSHEAQLLRQFQREVLQVPQRDRDMDAIDCIMTTMCTDRPLPAAIDDYRPGGSVADNDHDNNNNTASSSSSSSSDPSVVYGTNLLQRLYDFDAQSYVYNVKANEGEYAKLAMHPLWYEIMKNIYPHIHGQTTDLNKLAIFSGHDTTIIPLLASLGAWNDTTWAPYASMVIIELHEMNVDGNTDRKIFPSDFAFRLIYNGVVITSQLVDCPQDLELCDANVLINYVLQETNCDRTHTDSVPYKGAITRTKEIVSTTQGVLYFLLVVSTSACIGGVAVYIYLVKCFPKQLYHQTPDDEGGIGKNGYGSSLRYQDRQDEYSSEANLNEIS
jgi:Histidine phosphatase superfamily (branch 2)